MSRAKAKSTTRQAGKRPSVGDLYSDFEKAIAAYEAIPSSQEKRWQRADAKALDIARLIVGAAASSVDEMLLKIRVAKWTTGVRHRGLPSLDSWQPSGSDRYTTGGAEPLEALASLTDDLQRLKIGALGAGRPARPHPRY
jgi:hypothetical protein